MKKWWRALLLFHVLMIEDLPYQIALKKLDGIGSLRAKLLVSYCGGVRQIFEASEADFSLIPGMGNHVIRKLKHDRERAMEEAQAELAFVKSRGIKTYFYLDPEYPNRLKHCDDGPILLYGKGNMNLNAGRVVSIVGTRNNTVYGERLTEQLVAGLKAYDVLVVSGLAYGIDTIAHRESVKQGMQTIGVMGNSLDRVYPVVNSDLISQMQKFGGVLSEFDSGTKPDRENFPQRNRIVAGMADVTIVVETGAKGGSMITARLASGYNRDVAAFPGRTDDEFSAGCNLLIRENIAALIENADQLAQYMGWEKDEQIKTAQQQLFVELNNEEQKLMHTLRGKPRISLDNISLECDWPISKTSTLLLELEFKGMVKSLPGKVYELA